MRTARALAPLVCAALLVARSASSQGEAPPASGSGPRPGEAGDVPSAAAPAPWAVGFNPLAIAIGRYGGDVQRLIAPGHALIVNVHVDYASHGWPAMQYDRDSPVWGLGGEAGWRWYPSSRGMRGLFLGAALIGGWYSVDYYGHRLGLPGVGLAGDIGGQADLGGGFFLTVGGGLQYLWTASYPKDLAPGLSQVIGAGVDPRLLLTIGTRIR
jgi:hypothetical protein